MSTFNRADFEVLLDEIGDMLGDLKSIDDLKAAMAKGQPGSWQGSQPVYVNLDAVGIKYPIATRLPTVPKIGDTTGGDGQPSSEQIYWEAAYRSFQSTALADGRAVVADFRSAVKDIVRPVAGEFTKAAEQVRDQITDTLNLLAVGDFAALEHTESVWTGTAARQFFDYVYNSMDKARAGQVFTAEGIIFGIAASRAVVNQGQHAVMGLVEAVWKVLDAQLKARHADLQGDPPMSTADWLAIAGVVAALAASIPTGEVTAAAAITSVAEASGALLNFASSEVEGGVRLPIQASSAPEVVSSLRAGLDKTLGRLTVYWNVAETSTSHIISHINAAEAAQTLWPRQPSIPSHTQSGVWQHT